VGVREATLEQYLKDEIENLGGLCYKWVSPGRSNVPDRIVIINRNVFFIEVKTENGTPSSGQKREIERIKNVNGMAGVIYGKKEIDQFINFIKQNVIDVVQVRNPKSGRYTKIKRSTGEILNNSDKPYDKIPII